MTRASPFEVLATGIELVGGVMRMLPNPLTWNRGIAREGARTEYAAEAAGKALNATTPARVIEESLR